MAHNRMLDRVPSVAITKDRNELKIYQGNIVYLNDGDNFELRFFNPLSFKIGVDIVFNGIKRGDNLLVINPGQDITLERFLDEQRKMIFETYTVNGNNKEAVKAIQNNGDITFNFYEEEYKYSNKKDNINYSFPPRTIKYGITSSSSTGYQYSISSCDATGSSSLSEFGGLNFNISTANQKWEPNYMRICSEINFSDYLAENTTNAINYSDSINQNITLNVNGMGSVTPPNPLETGRIEMGEISNQKTKRVNSNFKSDPFYSFSYKLMPISSMNKTIGEIRQYCPHCSYRIRNQKWTFCPKCGNKII